MYLSDYGYASGNSCATNTSLSYYYGGCYQKDWLSDLSNNQWTMKNCYGDGGYVYLLYSNGRINANEASSWNVVRPSFYLTSTTSIIDGDGSLNNPYILK